MPCIVVQSGYPRRLPLIDLVVVQQYQHQWLTVGQIWTTECLGLMPRGPLALTPEPGAASLLRLRVSTEEEVEATVRAAHAAQHAWSTVPLSDRVELLKRAVRRLKADETALASLITAEMGKPHDEATEEARARARARAHARARVRAHARARAYTFIHARRLIRTCVRT
eukprot:5782747-Pleurochrysis_carterae.AAC.1